MKRITLLSTIAALMISVSIFAQEKPGTPGQPQVENIAKEVLKAYKTRDVELLKKNASGILKMAISESYFEEKNIQEDLKAVENWDGKIREVRYEIGNIMGEKILMATAYYADAPNNNEIYAVLLSSMDNKKWVFIGTGLTKVKKEDFEKLSKTFPSAETKQEIKAQKEITKEKKNSNKEFSIEMASGDTFDKVSQKKVTECFSKLDNDNFFIILSNKEDFLQAAYSDKGYTVEYKEDGAQYTAKDILSKEETIQLFKKYFQEEDDWKKGIIWEEVNY